MDAGAKRPPRPEEARNSNGGAASNNANTPGRAAEGEPAAFLTLSALSKGASENLTPMLLCPVAAETISSMLLPAESRLIHGVPYCERPQALSVLQQHFNLEGKNVCHFSLRD